MSFIFTQALNFGGDILSFGKLRASISEVGSDEAPYQLNFRYFPDQTIFGQFGTDLQFPFSVAVVLYLRSQGIILLQVRNRLRCTCAKQRTIIRNDPHTDHDAGVLALRIQRVQLRPHMAGEKG